MTSVEVEGPVEISVTTPQADLVLIPRFSPSEPAPATNPPADRKAMGVDLADRETGIAREQQAKKERDSQGAPVAAETSPENEKLDSGNGD